MSKGGDVLIIGAKEDEVIPGGVTRRYIKEVTYSYIQRLAKTGGDSPYHVGYMYIPEAHTRTTKEEIEGISEKFFKREKDE